MAKIDFNVTLFVLTKVLIDRHGQHPFFFLFFFEFHCSILYVSMIFKIRIFDSIEQRGANSNNPRGQIKKKSVFEFSGSKNIFVCGPLGRVIEV